MKYDSFKRFWLRFFYLVGIVGGLSLIWASLNAGCSAKDANSGVVLDSCSENAHCDAGEVCSALKVCLPRAQSGAPFALEISPDVAYNPQNSPLKLAPFEIPPWEITYNGLEGEQIPVTYEEAVRVSGTVSVDAQLDDALSASILAFRNSRIPGRPTVWTSTNVQIAITNPSQSSAPYSLVTAKGAGYTLRAVPNAPFDEQFHPRTMRNLAFGGDAMHDFTFGSENAAYVSGVITDAIGQPVEGAEVQAVDDTGMFISSLGHTDLDGIFMLSLPAGLRDYTVTAGPSDLNPTLPQVEFPDQFFGGDNSTYLLPEAIGSFALPAYPTPVTYQFAVKGRRANGVVDDIVGATVTFETVLATDPARTTYRVNAQSDELGVVTVALVPGMAGENRTYQVAISTPTGSEFRSIVRSVQVGPNSGAGEQFELERRVSVSGMVHTPLSGLLDNIVVQARRVDEGNPFAGLLSSTATDVDGRFLLLLDPGNYSLELVPPSGSPLPRWNIDNVNVNIDGNGNVHEVGAIGLPPGAVLEVKVMDAGVEPAPMPNVGVAVYFVSEVCAAAGPNPTLPCEDPALLMGTGMSDDRGVAQILIPQP